MAKSKSHHTIIRWKAVNDSREGRATVGRSEDTVGCAGKEHVTFGAEGQHQAVIKEIITSIGLGPGISMVA